MFQNLENFKKENNNSSSSKNKNQIINFPVTDLLKCLATVPETNNNSLIEVGMHVQHQLLNMQLINKVSARLQS